MALLIINDKTFEITDGERIISACEQGGVPFNCQSGNCGTCQIEIIEGRDNLYPLNENEMNMAMDLNNRLACQCRIMKDSVKISF